MSSVTSVFITFRGIALDNAEYDVAERINGNYDLRGGVAVVSGAFGGPKHPQLEAVAGTFNHQPIDELLSFLRDGIPWASYFDAECDTAPCVIALIQDEQDEHAYPVVLYGKPTIPKWASLVALVAVVVL